MSIITEFRSWITFSADVCILLITIYTFYLTFISSKIRITTFRRKSSNHGDSMSIVLENKSLSPISVSSVYAIVNKKIKFGFKEFDEPFVLPPFSCKVISMAPFSFIEDLDLSFDSRDIIFQVKTSNKNKIIPFKRRMLLSRKIKKAYPNVSIITRTYGDKIIMPGTKYILTLITNKETTIIPIFHTGIMVGEIFGYNALPEELMNDEASLKELLDSMTEPYGAKYVLSPFTFDIQ